VGVAGYVCVCMRDVCTYVWIISCDYERLFSVFLLPFWKFAHLRFVCTLCFVLCLAFIITLIFTIILDFSYALVEVEK